MKKDSGLVREGVERQAGALGWCVCGCVYVCMCEHAYTDDRSLMVVFPSLELRLYTGKEPQDLYFTFILLYHSIFSLPLHLSYL